MSERPLPPEKIIEFLGRISKETTVPAIEPGQRGACIGVIENLLGSRVKRQTLLFRVFPGKWDMIGNVTTKNMTNAEWYALYRWVRPHKPHDESPWYPDPDFTIEASLIMDKSDHREGQEHLGNSQAFFEEFCVGRFGVIPKMKCGHIANSLTAIFNPYCTQCADSGQNKDAYTIMADQSMMEIMENVKPEINQ